MTRAGQCVEDVTHSNILVSDRRSRCAANFLNPDRSLFRRVQVDGCIVTDNINPRADWIVSKVGVGSVIVELKGKNIDHACEQLLATLNREDCAEWLEGKVGLLIVCTRSPSFDSKVARVQAGLRKRGIRLKVKCGGGDFNIESLVAGIGTS